MRSLVLADFVVFLVAMLVTWILTPVAARVAKRVGAISYPNHRSAHTVPTPYLGGSAMYAGLVVAFFVAFLLSPLRALITGDTGAMGVLLSGLIVVIIMTIDDLRDISPPAKIAGLVLSASVLFLFGVTMTYFRIPFGELLILSGDVSPLVTALWVVLFCNALNLIDGLDGLAAGIAGIAATALFIFALRMQYLGVLEKDSLGPVICAATAGISLGFLRWNFNPAKIFMGDAGAMLLGLLLASATILIGGRVNDQFSGQTFFFFAPLVIPLVILGIPIADVFFSFLRRLLHGQGVATADRGHLHHRLLDLGHGERRTVVMLYIWSILLACVALMPTFAPEEEQGVGNRLVPFVLAGLALLLYALFHPGNPRLAHIWNRGEKSPVASERRFRHERGESSVHPKKQRARPRAFFLTLRSSGADRNLPMSGWSECGEDARSPVLGEERERAPSPAAAGAVREHFDRG